jgi:general L-amino acid transport system substrate-binding protein
LTIVVAATAALHATSAAAQSPTLEAVRARGALRCGVSTGFPGFAAPDAQGRWRGLDVDACRAVAAAALGDAARVQYVALTAVQRFTALQSGEIDMLARNATWTLSRATQLGLDFVVTNYYDGTGFMVPQRSGVTTIAQLNGATICVQQGADTAAIVQDHFRRNGWRFTPLVIESLEQMVATYIGGRCDAVISDQTQLVGMRANTPDPAAHVVLSQIVSKEPLSIAVRYGDDRWANIVRWSVLAMVEAEELGLSSANLAQAGEAEDPPVQRFAGRAGNLGQGLGLDNAWAMRVVAQVGNYGESFERNLRPLGVERGLNRLWRDGGLMIAPPFR